MALEIITGGNSHANVTTSMRELIPTYHWIHSIHIMSYNIDLIMENIALEIITGGVSTAHVTISSDNIWSKCLSTRPYDAIEVCFYQILANVELEIITGGNANANVTILSRCDLIPIFHCIHPMHTMSYDICLILENIALGIITGGVFIASVTKSSDIFWYKCLCTRHFDVI